MDVNALKERDFYIVIDKSGSMAGNDTQSGKTRWIEAKESTIAIAQRVTEWDPDGIDVYTYSGGFHKYDNCTAAKVEEIFNTQEPMGGTRLAPVLSDVFTTYLSNKKAGKAKLNGALCIVVTDGQPEDENVVASTISKFTKELSEGRTEFGIEFIQVGKDVAAAAFLKRLDDGLVKEGAKYDIVNTITMDEMGNQPLVDVLIKALTA